MVISWISGFALFSGGFVWGFSCSFHRKLPLWCTEPHHFSIQIFQIVSCELFSFLANYFAFGNAEVLTSTDTLKTFPWRVTPPLKCSMGMPWVHCWLRALYCAVIINPWSKQRHIFSYQMILQEEEGDKAHIQENMCLVKEDFVSSFLFPFLPSSISLPSPHSFHFFPI